MTHVALSNELWCCENCLAWMRHATWGAALLDLGNCVAEPPKVFEIRGTQTVTVFPETQKTQKCLHFKPNAQTLHLLQEPQGGNA